MVNWISSWVRQIALVVILAGVVELALPRGSTRGYVRVVTGLLVMLTVLQPFMQAMGQQVSWAEPESWSSELEYEGPAGQLDIPEIEENTRWLTLEAYREKVAQEIESVLRRVDTLEVVSVAVDIETRQERPDYGSVLAVAITVRPAASLQVEPVEPISTAEGGATRPGGEWPPQLKAARGEVFDLLRLNFGLQRDQVQLLLVS